MAVIDKPQGDALEQTEAWQRPPVAMLAELTHRCPLQCPYCSNPLALSPRSDELTTQEWIDTFRQAAKLGVLQVHLSGGEPTARKDLAELIAAARDVDIYTNLITAGVLLDEDRLKALKDAGLDHLQLSIQDSDPVNADVIGHYKGGLRQEDGRRPMDPPSRPALDGQCRGASPESRQSGSDHRSGR